MDLKKKGGKNIRYQACPRGIEVKAVTGGSTGTAEIKAAEGLYTELQAGSYLFMDSTYRTLSLPFKNSLFLLGNRKHVFLKKWKKSKVCVILYLLLAIRHFNYRCNTSAIFSSNVELQTAYGVGSFFAALFGPIAGIFIIKQALK